MKQKLNVLLAVTDHLGSSFKASIQDYVKFFKDSKSSFRGGKKTYDPASGTIDLPSERGNNLVVTTVDEKLDWFTETQSKFIDALFSQEATNAAGIAKSKLTVDGIEFGEYSSLELLRLKSILENGELELMYANIPVRADDEEWNIATDSNYTSRKTIYEGVKLAGEKKSTTKESYIISDPNLANLKPGSNYQPQLGVKETIMVLGNYTAQKFSGEWAPRERAELLRRRTKMLNAVIEALKIANEVEVVDSNMTAAKLFGYLHAGKIA